MIYYNIINDEKVFFESDIIFANYEAIQANEIEQKQYFFEKAKSKKLADLDNYHDSDETRNLKIKTSKNLFIYSTLPDARNILVEQIDANRNGIECGLIAIDKAGFLFFQNGKVLVGILPKQ